MADSELSVLYQRLADYYDDSSLQPPIKEGDPLHSAIRRYRDALPGQHLPPKEGQLMRSLLGLSRSPDIDKRRDSQSVAERWAGLLRKKMRAGRPQKKEATVNERMAAAFNKDPLEHLHWPASKWAVKLGVTAAAVKQTPTWTRTIKNARVMSKAERMDRAR
jgi:hypothetical protein